MFTGAKAFHAVRGFLFYKEGIMAFRAFACHRSGINHKLAFRIAIAGIKGFAKARPTLNQMAIATLRTVQCGFVRFVDLFSVFALRITAAADKHAETPLP